MGPVSKLCTDRTHSVYEHNVSVECKVEGPEASRTVCTVPGQSSEPPTRSRLLAPVSSYFDHERTFYKFHSTFKHTFSLCDFYDEFAG